MILKLLPFRLIDIIVGLTKMLTGAQGVWKKASATNKQKIYFANHTSNLDTIIIWAALPFSLRNITRPVAAKDYWNKPGLRQHIATKELNVVFIERAKENRSGDPLEPLRQALREGYSLIVFPEGQRNKEVVPDEFKSGIFRLHQEFPDVELLPVYLENVAKTFPRGAPVPLPVICLAHFGAPMDAKDLNKELFLKKARQEVIDLIPVHMRLSVPNFNDQVINPPKREK